MTINTRIIVVLTVTLGFIAIVLLAFKPSKISKDNSTQLNGIVSGVDIGGQNDIVVIIEGVRGIHFIDKGVKRGINIDSLKDKIVKKQVTLYYSKPSLWGKLSPMTDTRRITELSLGSEIIFSDFH